MTTYRTIASSETQPQAPVTSELMIALADNPTAIAEGSSGSPTMEVAWHELEVLTAAVDTTTITLTTDISAYRAVRLIGGAAVLSTVNNDPLIDVEVNIGGGWRTLASEQPGSTDSWGVMLDVHLDNVDNNDSSGQRLLTGMMAFATRAAGDWDADRIMSVVAPVAGVWQDAGSATGIRIVNNTAQFDVSQGDATFRLYGIKRTQP